ncbi:MAG: hypothetical protein CM15mP42_09670 [Methanobacteriota archaeon]|nr:MAG: hypothetical protein CM15mP42_09670 [Euryarchaeota archaeon]
MDFNKHKKNNFLKKNSFENEKKTNVEDVEILTNIEAFELGKFPSNLVEKVTLPKLDKENYIESEIKPKHLEILEKRPLPEMLDNSKLVGNLKQVESPSLGKFYEEKKIDETMKKEKYPNKT